MGIDSQIQLILHTIGSRKTAAILILAVLFCGIAFGISPVCIRAEQPSVQQSLDLMPAYPPRRIHQPDREWGPFENIKAEYELNLGVGRHKILRAKHDVIRTYVEDPTKCDIVQFNPRELALTGNGEGTTRIVFWFRGGRRTTACLIRVQPGRVTYGVRKTHLAP